MAGIAFLWRKSVRITRSDGQHLIVLSDDDAQILMQTCALMVTAVHSQPGLTLPPAMQTVLCQLFSGLCASSRQPRDAQG
jgi:hypothetical protein